MVCHAFSLLPSMKKKQAPTIITLAIGKDIATEMFIDLPKSSLKKQDNYNEMI